MKIKDIPEVLRPREKAKLYGIDSLSDAELLAILINNGYQGQNALDIADELLKLSNGLYNLGNINQRDLKKIKGIGKVKSTQLLSLFALMNRIKNKRIELDNRPVDPEYINEKYGDYLASLPNETVVLLILNRNKRLICERTIYKGNTTLVSVSINEVIKEVILHDGYYFYLVHNHPSGNSDPSPQDILLTIRLNMAIKGMNIFLLDHIIIHHMGYTSIKSYYKHKHNLNKLIESIDSNNAKRNKEENI